MYCKGGRKGGREEHYHSLESDVKEEGGASCCSAQVKESGCCRTGCNGLKDRSMLAYEDALGRQDRLENGEGAGWMLHAHGGLQACGGGGGR